MLKRDDDAGAIIGLMIIFVVVAVIIYAVMIFAGIAAVGGTVYGGGSAIKNYVSSFKENVIDSNRPATMVA